MFKLKAGLGYWQAMTETSLNPCQCCAFRTLLQLGAYEICDVCGWEDDPVQSADPEFEGGANNESLNEARAR